MTNVDIFYDALMLYLIALELHNIMFAHIFSSPLSQFIPLRYGYVMSYNTSHVYHHHNTVPSFWSWYLIS